MYLQKVISKKFFKNLYLSMYMSMSICWHLWKVNDENSRIRSGSISQSMDPRIQIRIRIHPKMSWIRNTVSTNQKLSRIK
jgi:hypothetical protein